MARVQFNLEYFFDAPAQVVFEELVDWKGHENWIPSTQVEIHTSGDPAAPGAEFTAWTGLALGTTIGRKLSLQDRMRVESSHFDDLTQVGECKVEKIGPLLTGWAAFTVEQLSGETSSKTRMHWVEDVKVPYAPQFVAPVGAVIGKNGFLFGMRQLEKLLASR